MLKDIISSDQIKLESQTARAVNHAMPPYQLLVPTRASALGLEETQAQRARRDMNQLPHGTFKNHNDLNSSQQTLARMAYQYLENHTSVLLGVFLSRDRREKLSLAHQCANFGAQNCSPDNFISDFLLCPQCKAVLTKAHTTKTRTEEGT